MSIAHNTCLRVGVLTRPSAKSVPVTGSMTGVPVIPTGLMFPQLRLELGTGEARGRRQCRERSDSLSAYTVLLSVATSTRPDQTRGDAYNWPSSIAEV